MLSAVSTLTSNSNRHLWSMIRPRRNIFHLPQRQQSIHHFSKHDMFPIQKGTWLSCDEELTTIRPWSAIRHAQQPRFVVFHGKVLIFELLPIDRFRSCTVGIDEITSLTHKVFDDSVKDRIFVSDGDVVATQFASTQLTKVFRCTRHHVGEQLEFQSTCGSLTDRDIHKDNRSAVCTCAWYRGCGRRRCHCEKRMGVECWGECSWVQGLRGGPVGVFSGFRESNTRCNRSPIRVIAQILYRDPSRASCDTLALFHSGRVKAWRIYIQKTADSAAKKNRSASLYNPGPSRLASRLASRRWCFCQRK